MSIEIFELAKSVNIKDVIEKYFPLTKQGEHYLIICPFHNDKNIGSFKITPRKNIFKCWACGEEGDAIDFVSKYCGISSRQAAIKIAEDHKLITAEEAGMLNTQGDRAFNISFKPKQVVKKQYKLANKASVEHLNLVYQAFADAAGHTLSTRFRNILLNERKLAENELQDYFVFPSPNDKNFWLRFRRNLAKNFGVETSSEQAKLLIGVPGFFIDKNNCVTFINSKKACLGIVVRDREKNISGIQLRVMENLKVGEHRYRFMSSGFANGDEASCGRFGCACGYIEDVLFPSGQQGWRKAIAITEGRFKAVTLSKMGFIVVNMHSTSNWRPAGDVASELIERYGATKVVLAYDQEENQATTNSAYNLAQKLSSVPVYCTTWDNKYGKGIDDVVNAGYKDVIKCITAKDYFKHCA